MNHYETLGVSPSAPKEQIKKAYSALALQHHPDKGGDVEKFRVIHEAYKSLSNENDEDSPMGFKSYLDLLKRFVRVVHLNLDLTLEQIEEGGVFPVDTNEEETYGPVMVIVPSCHDERTPLRAPLAMGRAIIQVQIVDKEQRKHRLHRCPGTLDLETTIEITLREALTGFIREIDLLHGKTFTFECTSTIIHTTMVTRLPELGLKNDDNGETGDLVVKYVIHFPSALDASTRAQLKDLLPSI